MFIWFTKTIMVIFFTRGFVADLDEYFSVISAGLSDPKDYVH